MSDKTTRAILKAIRSEFLSARNNDIRRVIRHEYEALNIFDNEKDKDEGWDFISLPLLDKKHLGEHNKMDDKSVYDFLKKIEVIK